LFNIIDVFDKVLNFNLKFVHEQSFILFMDINRIYLLIYININYIHFDIFIELIHRKLSNG